MIVRNVKDVIGTPDEVRTDTWMSRRVLLKKDNMGFSFHETTIFPGTRTHIHYKNHLEAVWCIEGDGSIETIADGKRYELGPGVVYALNEHDEHWLCGGKEPLRVICVFNPPLTGQEVHDADGVYALPEAEAA
ncbi:ectoine synthase [Bordetella hinzii]|uniref:L-ectoine synthase n=4 Tax=Bordetella TaxID=517 RepID=A0AAN1RX97_9BORD|nr:MULTISPECIES: ectoine synthase [Bordetella]AKQ56764.1 L-ectoine synthase [Bordetella hinzii]AKQ61231.1 L-ectoine synthase [Bordetella hinzii]ANY15342.1 L-ectoine synthase [Bordetella pseudohinzii]AZW17776.1 L-ectoine synthase [Bordetella hinzii]KCB21956.1 ectoine synthase [Bordetella hinzii OH87 BAL007II]